MPLMKFPNPLGWMYATPDEVDALVKRGWVVSSEKERQDIIAAKHKKEEPEKVGAVQGQESKAKQKPII